MVTALSAPPQMTRGTVSMMSVLPMPEMLGSLRKEIIPALWAFVRQFCIQ